MLVNAALELAPDDPEFQRLVAEEMVFIEAFFRRCIEAGQNDGAIADARPADELAISCSPFASWRERFCRERYKH
jgi:TetR/AcrR family transcriptional repressor of nem operon